MPSSKKKVFVGLSGGVDSAVSAALLKQQGYDVAGVFVRIALPGYPCPAGEDRREALRVAAHLQIPFLEIDLSKEYQTAVFKSAMEAYARGETPNPDALCNREIKFGLLWDFAMANGADYLATGHYAQVHTISNKGELRTQLFAGKDKEKDQSYFLWAVPEDRLAKTLFPVGNLHKKEVRALAKNMQLPNAERKDSQGLCFLGGVSMDDALMRELSPAPGDVLSERGAIIGTHRGAVLYTLGERHGFSVSADNPDTQPLYVVAKDIARNSITVAPRPSHPHADRSKSLGSAFIALNEENWIGPVEDGPYQARFRYRQKLFPAKLKRQGGQSIIEMKTKEAIPIGQSFVVYAAERCLGGGVIAGS